MSVVATDSVTAKITGVTYTPPLGSPQDHIDVKVKNYSITLDKGHSPYVDATLTVTTPEPGAVLLMDPTSLTLRCYVTLTKTGVVPAISTKTRNFDLAVRSVKNDAATGETTITLSSDECLLIVDMYAGAAADTSFETYQASLRSIVSAALATYGYTLNGTPSVDADYTMTANATNLILNPTVRTAVGSWVAGGANGTLTRLTGLSGGPVSGVTTYTHTAWTGNSGVGSGGANSGGSFSVTAGQVIKVSCWVRASVTKTVHLGIQWTGGPAANVGTDVALTANTWTLLTDTFTVPTGATAALLFVYPQAAQQWVNTNTFDTLGWMLIASPTGIHDTSADYFDGTVGDTTHYTLAWTGTADASASTRTRLDSRDTKVLDRVPGSAMWDWLSSLVQPVGYRLFCDEARVWRLVDNSYTVAGAIALTQAINLTQGVDTIDIGQADTDGQGWVQKVQVVYQWIDRVTTNNMTAYDYAGSGHGPGICLTINTPYPGPGYAAAVLARLQGREHVLNLRALSDVTTTPGMEVTASLPSLNETGLIASVTWTDQDEMDVGTEGLITIPANAWSLALGAWSAATGTWAGATGTN